MDEPQTLFDLPVKLPTAGTLTELKPVFEAMDELLRERIAARVQKFDLPDDLYGAVNPNSKWRIVSALQKAIRRSDRSMAMNAASALHDLDPAYLMQRMAVIAAEDLGVNWPVVSVALVIQGKKRWRDAMGGDRRFAIFLADTLAAGWKDRSLTNLSCTIPHRSPTLDSVKKEMSYWPFEKLSGVYRDSGCNPYERLVAGRYMIGTERLGGRGLVERPGHPNGALRSAMAAHYPMKLIYAMSRMAKRVNEPLFVALPIAWDALQAGATVESPKLPPLDLLGKLPAAAYDQYTREGKSALRLMNSSARTAFDPHIGHLPYQTRICALGDAVFEVEGGLLSPEIVYGPGRWSAQVSREASGDVLRSYGVPNPARFMQAVQKHQGLLNWARRQVLS